MRDCKTVLGYEMECKSVRRYFREFKRSQVQGRLGVTLELVVISGIVRTWEKV